MLAKRRLGISLVLATLLSMLYVSSIFADASSTPNSGSPHIVAIKLKSPERPSNTGGVTPNLQLGSNWICEVDQNVGNDGEFVGSTHTLCNQRVGVASMTIYVDHCTSAFIGICFQWTQVAVSGSCRPTNFSDYTCGTFYYNAPSGWWVRYRTDICITGFDMNTDCGSVWADWQF